MFILIQKCWHLSIVFGSSLDLKDLRNWLCHSVRHITPLLTDVFKTENHCLDNFKIQPQVYSMVGFNNHGWI